MSKPKKIIVKYIESQASITIMDKNADVFTGSASLTE